MKPNPIKDRAVALAKQRHSAPEIYEILNRPCSLPTIKNWLTEARKAGEEIPKHSTRPGLFQKEVEAPAPRAAPTPLTPEDEARLAELAQRDIGLTSIAAHMRKPYSMIADAMQRLGLSRAGDISISTRAM